MRRTDKILIYLLFITYFLGMYQVFAIGSYGVTSFDLLLGIWYTYIIKRLVWNGDSLRFKWQHSAGWILVILFAALLSGVMTIIINPTNENLLQFIKSSSHFFFYVSFAFVCFIYPIDIKVWKNCVRIWLVIGILINIFGIYQIFARAYQLPFAWLTINNESMSLRGEVAIDEISQLSLAYGNFFRATSIFSEPSALASFNLILIVFYLVPYLQYREPFIKSRLFNIISILVMVISTFLTFSLTAFVGVAMILTTAALVQGMKRIMKFVKYGILFLVVVIATDNIIEKNLGTSVIELFSVRIASIFDLGKEERVTTSGDSLEQRAGSVSKSLKIWKMSPIFGVGLGQSQYIKSAELTFSDYSIFAALSEMGILGALALTMIFLCLFASVYKYTQTSFRSPGDTYESNSVAGILFYILVILFETNFISANNLINPSLWMQIGLIMSVMTYLNLKDNKDIIEISLVKKSLKEIFGEYSLRYIQGR